MNCSIFAKFLERFMLGGANDKYFMGAPLLGLAKSIYYFFQKALPLTKIKTEKKRITYLVNDRHLALQD